MSHNLVTYVLCMALAFSKAMGPISAGISDAPGIILK